jgi:hypothetical protein
MRKQTNVKNKHSGQEYYISTAKDGQGMWETAVFEAGVGIVNVFKPLLVENDPTEVEAEKTHLEVQKIVTNTPEAEWKETFFRVGRIGFEQKMLKIKTAMLGETDNSEPEKEE